MQVFYGGKIQEAAADPNMAFALGGNGWLVSFVHVQLLLSIGARRAEGAEEWTLNLP